MFFSAYVGSNEDPLLWKEAMHRHATWLGLTCRIESRRLNDNRSFFFGWLGENPFNAKPYIALEEHLIINTSETIENSEHPVLPIQLWQRPAESMNVNVIRLIVSLQAGEVQIIIPPATPEPFYYTKKSQGYVVGNDMRLLMRLTELEIDDRAIYALFQYGAIPPTITMSKNIQRVPNGHTLRIIPRSDEIILKPFFQPMGEARIRDMNPEMQVTHVLDGILEAMPLSTAIYFSGGIDSGLLAARLAEMERTDIRLINYTFGPRDQEGDLAVRMAAHLGLSCEQIMYDPLGIPLVLERLGKDYSFPFGDPSMITQNLLVHASLQSTGQPATIINGTGADGAFGTVMNPRCYQIYLMPYSIRQMIAKGYERLKCWQYDSKMEYYARLFRQSIQMPAQHASIIAYNSLDGIVYRIPDTVRESLQQTIKARIQILGAGLSPDKQASLLDLVYVCAGRYAASCFDPLRRLGIRPIFPFLEPPMIDLSLSLQREKSFGGEDKALLKNLLACRVPKELVYRPKSYFFPPLQEILTYTPMQELLRNVTLSKKNPLIDFCRIHTVKQMVERARDRQALGKQACKFLWVLMFTSTWLSQLEFD
jgi:asparagine synthase (glutamine-hydrolysing)